MNDGVTATTIAAVTAAVVMTGRSARVRARPAGGGGAVATPSAEAVGSLEECVPRAVQPLSVEAGEPAAARTVVRLGGYRGLSRMCGDPTELRAHASSASEPLSR
jgi:hypothetical protein